MPPEIIVALLNTPREYGKYPIDTERIDEKPRELEKETVT